jgi:hypothetical protein
VWYVWIKLHRCTFHFPVSWFTCSTNGSYQKNHKYHAMKQRFDGEHLKELPPTHHDGKFVFKMVRNIHVAFGKGVKEKMKEKGKFLSAACAI